MKRNWCEMPTKQKKLRVLITGGAGLVGSAIRDVSKNYHDLDFIFTTHQENDLCKESEVKNLFSSVKPDYVIHTAARAGGLGRNANTPADQYYNNVLMNTYVIHYSHICSVKKLLSFSSAACFRPDLEKLKEDKLHEGEPHPSLYSYAYSKRMVAMRW